MWRNASLRIRLGFLLCSTLAFAMLAILALQVIFARTTLEKERGVADHVVSQIILSLSATLEVADDPERVLEVFLRAARENRTGIIGIEQIGAGNGSILSPHASSGIPSWYKELLGEDGAPTRIPVTKNGQKLGDLIYVSDMSSDIEEKWFIFVALVITLLVLTFLTFLAAYFLLGVMLRPLANIEKSLTDLRAGNYDVRIPCEGSPELVKSSQQVNELAGSLHRLSGDRSRLLRQVENLQENERSEIAKELHDELGPILFAIRAHATSLSFSTKEKNIATELMAAVEILQQANRRILDRLQPLRVEEIGLLPSIESIINGPGPKAVGVVVSSDLDGELAEVERIVAETIYRVIQEGLTNVLRHANSTKVSIVARLLPEANGRAVSIVIRDDGNGLPSDFKFGRGLRGMSDRIRVLGGTMSIASDKEGTQLRCSLPILHNAPSLPSPIGKMS